MSHGYAVCKHLPLLQSAWTEEQRKNSRLCSQCDTLYCWRSECADAHHHRKSVFACVDSLGWGPQKSGALIGLILAARCGRSAMTEEDFLETAQIVWNWEMSL